MIMFLCSNCGVNLRSCKKAFLMSFLFLVFWVLLSACAQEQQATPRDDQSQTQDETTETEEDTTAMIDHIVEEEFHFNQYRLVSLEVDLSQYQSMVAGDYFVFKIYNADQTYYLDYRSVLGIVVVQLSVPEHLSELSLQLFSNNPQGGQINEVIQL